MPDAQIEPPAKSRRPTGLNPANRQAIARTIDAQMRTQGAKALASFEQDLAEISQIAISDAKQVLLQVSQIGTLICANLQRHAQRERLTLADVEAISKIWERVQNVTRRVLRLDETDQSKASVRIGLFLQCGRPGETPLQHVGMQHAGVAQSMPALPDVASCSNDTNNLCNTENNLCNTQSPSCVVDTMSATGDNSVIHKLPATLQGSRERGLAKARQVRLDHLARRKASVGSSGGSTPAVANVATLT